MPRHALTAVITGGLLAAGCLVAVHAAPKEYPLNEGKAVEATPGRQTSDEELERRRQAAKLRATEMPGLDLEKVTLAEAVDALRQTTGVNLFVNWRALEVAGVRRETPVSITLDKTTLGTALQLVLDVAAGGRDRLGFTFDDGVLTISTTEDLTKNTITRVYDVRDIVPANPAGAKPAGRDPRRIEALQRLIVQTVEPKTWRVNGGNAGAIRELSGQLIITQTPDNQEAIKNLLTHLGELMNPAPDTEAVAPAE